MVTDIGGFDDKGSWQMKFEIFSKIARDFLFGSR